MFCIFPRLEAPNFFKKRCPPEAWYPKTRKAITIRIRMSLVAEWIHFILFGIILLIITHYKTESVHFSGLMNSATK